MSPTTYKRKNPHPAIVIFNERNHKTDVSQGKDAKPECI